jgi:hypothetical protein
MPVLSAEGSAITTVEGLGSHDSMGEVQVCVHHTYRIRAATYNLNCAAAAAAVHPETYCRSTWFAVWLLYTGHCGGVALVSQSASQRNGQGH